MRRLLLTNSASSLSLFFVRVCASFLMTPVIIHALGNYDYGLWTIVFSVVGYMGMLDIGMRPAVVRYVAKFRAENDRASLDQLFSSVLVFNGAIGLFCFGGLLLWGLFSPAFFTEQAAAPGRYLLFFVIVAFQVLCQFPGYVAECFHEGHQRYPFMNGLTIFNTVTGNTITYFLLKHGYGLLTLTLMNALGFSWKYFLYHVALSREKFGKFRWQRKMVSLPMLRSMLAFGTKTFVQSLAGMVTETANLNVIGYMIGAASVPYYSIPAQLVGYVRQMSLTVTNVFMPMFSHLHASQQKEELKALYLNASRYIIGCIYPIMINACLLGPAFLAIWVGPTYAEGGAKVLNILTGAYLILFCHPLHQRFMVGVDKVAFLAKIRVVSCLFFLISSVTLVHFFGVAGAAFALLANYAVFEPVVLRTTCRVLEISMAHYTRSVLIPVFVPSALLVVILRLTVNSIRLNSYGSIIGTAMGGGIVYLLFFSVFSLNSAERRFIYATLPRKIVTTLQHKFMAP